MNVTTAKSTSLLSLFCAFLAVSALPLMASEYTYWNGSVDSNWNTPGNWNQGLPSDAVYAQFGSPYDTPLTLTIDGLTKVYAFYVSGSRTADLTFMGAGAFETYRAAEIVDVNGGSCHLTFNVDVTNATSSAQTILGHNTFLKSLYIGPDKEFNIGNSAGKVASVSFEGTADMTARSLYIYDNSSLQVSDSSVLNLMDDSYLKVYRSNSVLSLSDNAVLNGKYLTVYSGASATISNNVQVNLSRDLTVNQGGSLVVSGNPTINLRKLTLPFSPEPGVSDEWAMNGGTFCATNDSNYQLYLPYTNAVKTLSGTGTFHLWRFYISNASNLTVRLNGPDAYVNAFAGGKDNKLSIGNGSTFGMWGADIDFKNGSILTLIEGDATFDTTDYQDGKTGRHLTLGYLHEDSSGVMTVKGCGTCTILRSFEHPNLGITGKDDASIVITNYPYAIGDIVLHDRATMNTTAYYLGHKGEPARVVKSLTMDGDSSLDVGRYAIFTGDVTLSGNANAVIRNKNNDSDPILTCANLSLSDNASLVVTGQVSATEVSLSGNASLVATKQLAAESLSISGDAHLAFAAGTAFTAGAILGNGNWTLEITIPSGYEEGIHPILKGAGAMGDFADHVTLVGETTGWSVRTVGDDLVLYSEAPPIGIEWIGKSTTSNNWSDNANWNDGNVPTADDIVAFGGFDRPESYNDSISTVSGLVFRASAGPFTLTGSVERLSLTADCESRGSASADNASIASHSAYDQTITTSIDFGSNNAYLLSAGGGTLKLLGGINGNNDWHYLVVGGDVWMGGTCSVGILSFKKSTTVIPTCMRILNGCNFTVRNQYFRGIVESSSYIGRLVIEEGGEMTIKDGDCVFWSGELENVIDGTLTIKGDKDNGRLVGSQSEQYYTGNGTIYADSARSGRTAAVASHYINIGGTLKLYMNGNWWTATYRVDGSNVMQNPNYPTRFHMTDGTTLGATKDWTYGPRDGAYDVIANTLTPADRTSIMTGTVTVDTQSPKDDAAHTITFVDPLDASAANVVKVGAGSLVFNPTNGCPSQVSNLTVNAGTVLFKGDSSPTVGGVVANAGIVRFDVGPTLGDLAVSDGATASFAAVPTLSGSLTIASTEANFFVDGVAETMNWALLATAAEIVGPNNETKWKTASGKRRFKIVSEGSGKVLYGAQASGFALIVR